MKQMVRSSTMLLLFLFLGKMTTECHAYAQIKSYKVLKQDGKIVAFRSKESINAPDIAAIVKRVKLENVQFIQLEFTDAFGEPKSFTITADLIESACTKGMYFDGSSIAGYTTVEASDLLLKPDPTTFKILPWTRKNHTTARLICDIYLDDGTPYQSYPRTILKRILEEARMLGYEFNVSPELEFYLIKANKQRDQLGYFDPLSLDETLPIKLEILSILHEMNLNPEKTHHEVANNQHEITTKYGPALQIADNLITIKNVIATVANRHGYRAVFMPKPFFGESGNGMHIHFSLFDSNTNVNIFYDQNDLHSLSKIAQQFIAGVLRYTFSLSALFNPIINSYKRLVVGFEAPIYICWGSKNRSALIRIPQINAEDACSARAEIRSPDATCNPYLAFAALLKAGLEGIKKQLSLPPEVQHNLFECTSDEIATRGIQSLPSSLKEAIDEFSASVLAKELLGEKLHASYCKSKREEVADFQAAVTDWELERYF